MVSVELILKGNVPYPTLLLWLGRKLSWKAHTASSHATNSASMDSLSKQAAGAQQCEPGSTCWGGTVRAQIGLASQLESQAQCS